MIDEIDVSRLSPMMKLYVETKKQYPGCILFYRLGDFYEMFFDDAIMVSRELEITLTGKECGLDERAPMCGVPFHSAETYIAKLIKKGYKVGICEQTEDPAKAKGLVKREIIRVVTPGTVTESTMLDDNSNNFLCAVYTAENSTGLAFCDISTGELYATALDGDAQESEIKNELLKYKPSELLIGGEAIRFRTLGSVSDRKSTRLNSSHIQKSRMPSSA